MMGILSMLALSGIYVLCKGNSLKDIKLRFGKDIDVPTKTTFLGLFDFRSFLNIGMLLTESEKAKWVRSRILDIVVLREDIVQNWMVC